MRKILFVFIILLLTVSCGNLSDTEEAIPSSTSTVPITEAPTPEPTPFEPEDIKIILFELNDDEQRLYIDYKYLESSDYPSGSVEEMLATTIRTTMDESIEWIKEAAREYPTTKDNYVSYGLSNLITIMQNDSNYLSVLSDEHIYTGGAHGNVERHTYVFDRNSNKLCSLEDLFNEGTTMTDVEIEVNRQMAANIEESGPLYFEDTVSFSELAYQPCFYLKDNQLIICFQTYEIAPHAAGIQEFTMPSAIFLPPAE